MKHSLPPHPWAASLISIAASTLVFLSASCPAAAQSVRVIAKLESGHIQSLLAPLPSGEYPVLLNIYRDIGIQGMRAEYVARKLDLKTGALSALAPGFDYPRFCKGYEPTYMALDGSTLYLYCEPLGTGVVLSVPLNGGPIGKVPAVNADGARPFAALKAPSGTTPRPTWLDRMETAIRAGNPDVTPADKIDVAFFQNDRVVYSVIAEARQIARTASYVGEVPQELRALTKTTSPK